VLVTFEIKPKIVSTDLGAIRALLDEYRVATVILAVLDKIRLEAPKEVFLSMRDERAILKAAKRLDELKASGAVLPPLFGLPFAVKDNIDVQGCPTTCACPDFSYQPDVSAFAVEELEQTAGAVFIGKTNMDQFAAGLVGVRSPYGAPRSVFNSEYVSGGSSSGSAVSVAANFVSFSLGTDTAGSGRVRLVYVASSRLIR
jgi:allophanate hydrolase